MKPSLFRVILLCPVLAAGVAGCSPSPYYTGSRNLAPGAVPRDGMGRPVLDGKAVVYDLPPPAPQVTVDVAGRPSIGASAANQIIYYEDLRYSDRPQQVAGANVRDQGYRP